MPTYVYRREDGSTFEIEQRITADPLAEDPETGQPVKRIISGSAGLIFKGSGFYQTDYVRKNGEGAEAEPEKEPSKAGPTRGADSTADADSAPGADSAQGADAQGGSSQGGASGKTESSKTAKSSDKA